MTIQARWAALRDARSKEGGYVAVMTAILLVVLMGLAAFAVDVGNWYLVGQQEQRAADAAVMAGVTYLPSDSSLASTTAQKYAKINGFQNGVNATTVTTGQDGRPTRLRVTVNRMVSNLFGSLLGVPSTTIGRTAVADFAGPVPMGSPCNRFGNNPDPGTTEATTCSGVLGEFWANVNSPKSNKQNGDAYQGNVCSSSVDGCSGSSSGPNIDYATDGYFYTISVKAAMSSLTIELFDPVWVNTGLTCDTNFGSGTTRGIDAVNNVVSDPTTRYKPNTTSPVSYSPYCTGDGLFSGTQAMNTQFTVRDPSTTPWDTSTFPVHATCQKTYPGYSGSLFNVLDQYTSGTTPRSTYNKDSTGTVGPQTIVNGFRRWTTLCTIANPVVGDYLVQVKTNGLGTSFDNADASNHFGIRAFGSASGDKESISVFGREKMGIYSNKPSVVTEFHLARVPSSAAGQFLKVRLFDVGDSTQAGTIKILSPPDAAGGAFTGCVGVLSTNAAVNLTNCSLTVQTSTHNGKWQSVSVPIPSNYTCTDADTTKCWVRLQYDYGSGSAPTDVTAWTASIEGDPVRLVE
jgi:Flp pilus assembly protein TadG